jgi:hypothetical protein
MTMFASIMLVRSFVVERQAKQLVVNGWWHTAANKAEQSEVISLYTATANA